MTQGLVFHGAVIQDQQRTEIEKYWDVHDDVYQELVMAGFEPLRKPAGEFPEVSIEDYLNIEGEQYTRTMAWIDIWFAYASDILAWLKGRELGLTEELEDIERELKKLKRQEYESLPKKSRPSEAELREVAESHPRCREIRRDLVVLRNKIKVVQSRVDALERFAKGLSRQVTIRGQNIELGGAVGGRRPPAPIVR